MTSDAVFALIPNSFLAYAEALGVQVSVAPAASIPAGVVTVGRGAPPDSGAPRPSPRSTHEDRER